MLVFFKICIYKLIELFLNMVTNACDYIYKILLLGDVNVGKTCFILSYVDEHFDDKHISTIGVDFKTKLFQINSEEILKLQIWDTAGQDKFKCITKNYFRGTNAIILIYDITSKSSFKNIKNWLAQIKEILADEALVILVGNKCDLENERLITLEQGLMLANEYKLSFFESSAKENISIKEIFEHLIIEMLRKFNPESLENKYLDKEELHHYRQRYQSCDFKKFIENDPNKICKNQLNIIEYDKEGKKKLKKDDIDANMKRKGCC